ncbi:MAG: choice-of-anchor R domain-containing protein [Verrucomicrobiota bacterium]
MILIRPLVLSAFLIAGSTHAVTVIDSFSGSSNGNAAASGPTAGFFLPGTFVDREAAFDFHTGSTAAWLDQLDIAVAIGNNTTALEASLTTGISAPGSNPVSLGSFTPASPTPAIQTVSFLPTPNTVQLQPNTRYWIHLTVSQGGGIYTLTYSDTQNNVAGWMLDETWAYTPPGAIPPTGWNQDGTPGVVKARIEATLIPEPSSILLGGLGLTLLLRRRIR